MKAPSKQCAGGSRSSQSSLSTPLAQLLAERIRAGGPIPFAEYMRECLYHPQFGYYSKAEARRFADYYTSVDVHPIFGRLLARQLSEMWDLLGRPREFFAVEAGAGGGGWRRTSSTSRRESCRGSMAQCAISPSRSPPRAVGGRRKRLESTWRMARLRQPRNCRATSPPDASSRMSCWTHFQYTAFASKAALGAKSISLAMAGA